MASSATTTAFATATTSLRRHNLAVEMSFSNNYISFFKKPLVKFSVRTSSDDDASSSLAAAAEAEPIDESSIEVPKGPPSLISALNVEKALRGIAITDVDHYGILGLKKGCSYDQVKPAYNVKVEELMNQGLEQEELTKQLDQLKESYSILSSVEERRLYDWSLARNENVDRYAWPFEVDITQTETVNSPDTPPPQEPENVEPTRLVGYFLLTWIILSITLSVAFNR
ncbi:hypothetical protein M8C21_032318 [Ambrosia artemisiifolia]|uniref:J domain-containing protein n=1 Tax=Ambrosia artemisiifolia TaxID=4212 RepID=A0AAD5D042_AMBAR|nr:hypothetical protein M8C21_032318 [Ambrosia artemisiifolia]